jgi:hypothetical protein
MKNMMKIMKSEAAFPRQLRKLTLFNQNCTYYWSFNPIIAWAIE